MNKKIELGLIGLGLMVEDVKEKIIMTEECADPDAPIEACERKKPGLAPRGHGERKVKKKTKKKAPKRNRLSYENDWEYRTYFVDGKEIDALREVEIAGEKFAVFSSPGTELVYDMGHKYTCTSLRHYINVSLAGKKLPMALEVILDEKIAVTATKFDVYEKPRRSRA